MRWNSVVWYCIINPQLSESVGAVSFCAADPPGVCVCVCVLVPVHVCSSHGVDMCLLASGEIRNGAKTFTSFPTEKGSRYRQDLS